MFVDDGGTLDLVGTADAPVRIESAAERPFPGDWQQITFDTTAGASLWTHASVRHGGSNGRGAVYVEADNRVSFESVTFDDNQDCDVDRSPPNPVTVPASDTPYVDCP